MKIASLHKGQKKARSKASEKNLAQLLGGQVQIASGAIQCAALKGDVITKRFHIDDKTTGSASFAVSEKLFAKLELDSMRQRRSPAISINFEGTGRRLFVINEREFLRLNSLSNEE